MVKFGTNRVVLIGKDYVYKIPIGLHGIMANNMEYNYSISRPYIAHTTKKWYGLQQEKLHDLITLPLNYKGEIRAEFRSLWENKLNNRFQIGKDKTGQYKYFDYEDIKYYIRGI